MQPIRIGRMGHPPIIIHGQDARATGVSLPYRIANVKGKRVIAILFLRVPLDRNMRSWRVTDRRSAMNFYIF